MESTCTCKIFHLLEKVSRRRKLGWLFNGAPRPTVRDSIDGLALHAKLCVNCFWFSIMVRFQLRGMIWLDLGLEFEFSVFQRIMWR